jgi:hypothetical protein
MIHISSMAMEWMTGQNKLRAIPGSLTVAPGEAVILNGNALGTRDFRAALNI